LGYSIVLNGLGERKSWFLVSLIWVLSIAQFYYLPILIDKSGIEFHEFILYFPLWHLNVFLVGVLCGKYILKINSLKGESYLIPRLMFSAGFILFVMFYLLPNPYVSLAHNGLLAPVFFLIIAGLSLDHSWLTQALSMKWLIALGESSYTMYIIQWPVMVILMQIMGVQDLELQGYDFALYLLIIVVSSLLIHYYFERPVRIKILNKFLTREQ
jgi:peptidoglycan/LPS O-acetylase OafA/YrhL